MFPDDPNLLPAFWDIAQCEGYEKKERANDPTLGAFGWVAKPKFGREGFGIRYSFESSSMQEFDQASKDYLASFLPQEANSGQHHALHDKNHSSGDHLSQLFPPIGKEPVFQV